MTTTAHRHRLSWSQHDCIICGGKAIGVNFGVPTCAPCKAFFRRNARRKEILQTFCHHPNKNPTEEDDNEIEVRYSQFRRCSTCRLRRCFEVGMKEELIRTDEENEQHKQLVYINRKRREIIKQQKVQENQLIIPQYMMNTDDLLTEFEWCHLSNLIYAYETHCIKTHLEYRTNMSTCQTTDRIAAMKHHALLPMNLAKSMSLYFRSLPAFQSLSLSNQSFLQEHNLRRLILINNHEIKQCCFSEPWQFAACKTSWQFICGPEIYSRLTQVEASADKLMITDPIVTRLWLIVLFFSTPLLCFYQPNSSTTKMKNRSSITHIQNGYVTLLWKYLLHRHGYMESARIYSNLIHVFLNILQIALSMHIRFETGTEYYKAKETFDQMTKLNINTVN